MYPILSEKNKSHLRIKTYEVFGNRPKSTANDGTFSQECLLKFHKNREKLWCLLYDLQVIGTMPRAAVKPGKEPEGALFGSFFSFFYITGYPKYYSCWDKRVHI